MNVYPEYFKEFLDDPSACSLTKFFEMVKAWGNYLTEHQELNYLTDDSWKEIRERLVEEFQKREDIRLEIEEEWEYLNELVDEAESMSDEEAIEYARRKFTFMRANQEFYNIPDEDLRHAEEVLRGFEEAYEAHLLAQKKLRRSEFEVENSLAALEEKLVKLSEKRGRPVHIHSFRSVKKHNGN